MKARDEHAIHSPFIFETYTKAIREKTAYPVYKQVEQRRKQLLTVEKEIEVEDFGAGSKIHHTNKRKVKNIAKYSAEKAPIGQLLYRLVTYFKPAVMLDLGTSLGITSSYMALGNPTGTFYTFEGAKQIAEIAEETFQQQGVEAQLILGNIDETLPSVVETLQQVDFVFFDANHRYQPTLNYFNICLSKAHEGSIFVFDDIYWSREMENAWKSIKEHKEVMLTIDLFSVGLVFFRKKQPKQHFILKL